MTALQIIPQRAEKGRGCPACITAAWLALRLSDLQPRRTVESRGRWGGGGGGCFANPSAQAASQTKAVDALAVGPRPSRFPAPQATPMCSQGRGPGLLLHPAVQVGCSDGTTRHITPAEGLPLWSPPSSLVLGSAGCEKSASRAVRTMVQAIAWLPGSCSLIPFAN